MINYEELIPLTRNINGWSLAFITQHGVRIWMHEDGGVQPYGVDDLTDEQYADVLMIAAGMKDNLSVPVPKRTCLSDEDLTDLVMLDRECLLTWNA